MKESDITPKTIKLAKEIAKYWRMDMYVGMGVAIYNGSLKKITTVGIIVELDEEDKSIWIDEDGRKDCHNWNNLEGGWLIPIPSISDCLEKLRELSDRIQVEIYPNCEQETWISLFKRNEENWECFYEEDFEGGEHEALLSVLLEALKVEK